MKSRATSSVHRPQRINKTGDEGSVLVISCLILPISMIFSVREDFVEQMISLSLSFLLDIGASDLSLIVSRHFASSLNEFP